MEDSGLHAVIRHSAQRVSLRRFPTLVMLVMGSVLVMSASSATAQNDWQFPDPYFGVPQPAHPAAPSIQRRYRTEIGPPAVRPQPSHPRPPQRPWRVRPRRDR
jgi:hypothetical protein